MIRVKSLSVAGKESNSLYRPPNKNDQPHDPGVDPYLFPRFAVGGSGNDASESKGGMAFVRDHSDSATDGEFLPVFNSPESTQSDVSNPKNGTGVEMEQIREEAFREGFDAGRNVGEEAQKEAIHHAVASVEAAITELDLIKKRLLYDTEQQAIDLALLIAQKIVRRTVSIDRDVICRVLRDALKKLDDHKRICIQIHPADFEIIEGSGVTSFGEEAPKRVFHLEPVESVSRGGCMIETDLGIIDATIQSQFQALEESLKRAFGNDVNGG